MYSYKYRLAIKIVALLSITIGSLVAIGWIFSDTFLVTLFSIDTNIKFCTAICLFLSGASLFFLFFNEKYLVLLQKIFSFALLTIAGISFFANIYNFDFIFNERFVRNMNTAVMPANPYFGRMLLTTSLSFSLIGLACFNMRSKQKWVRITMQWALHIVTLIAVVAIMGHMYEVKDFNKIPFLSTMAMHNAIALFCLSVIASLVNPSLGVTELFTGEKTGNIMVRRLFPVIVCLLLGITYVRLQIYRHGMLSMEFSTVLFTTFIILANLFLIWRTAVQLNKTDTKRKTAEDSILTLNKNLEQTVEHRTEKLKETLLDLEKSQRELNDSLDKEKQLNEIKSRFVSMASHEFKTPLSTILSSASLISRYETTENNANRDKHIQRIKNSVNHLTKLLEEFLSLGKLDVGRITIENEYFDGREFLQDLMEEINELQKSGQQIILSEKGTAVFNTDKRLLKNILLNILSNAIKFSPEQSVIEVNVDNKISGLSITVKDNGIGILEEDKQFLFSSFFRGANVANIQGTGLGLHIVKRYVDLLNGKMELQSFIGKGTCVTIHLPIYQEDNMIVTMDIYDTNKI